MTVANLPLPKTNRMAYICKGKELQRLNPFSWEPFSAG